MGYGGMVCGFHTRPCKVKPSFSGEGFDRFSPHKQNILSLLLFSIVHLQWQPLCIVKILLINNPGFKVVLVKA